MLSNTLAIIKETAQHQLNKNLNITDFLKFFKNYRINTWVYPGVLNRKFSLSFIEIYNFLNELEKQGILQSHYELYCSNCQKTMGIVHLFNELPESFECELCHNELDTLENTFIIYKVIRDD